MFFTGLLVGIVSLIPGISGGTIIMLSSKYEEILKGISSLNLKVIGKLLSGVIIGVLCVAKIIEQLFIYIPTQTVFFFIGLLIFSLPTVIHKEYKYFSFPFILIGAFIIQLVTMFTPTTDIVITTFPKLTITFLILFAIYGMIDGFFTILPGISGSLIMMILGPYYLYKSYLANISFMNFIPLLFYFIGDGLGVLLGSKISLFLLNKLHKVTISILIGMTIMSIVVIVPKVDYNFNMSITSLIAFILSVIPSIIIKKKLN